MKIIIARYNEDIAWVEGYDHFVVQKDAHCPNVGREASSHLWYLLKNYDTVEGVYLFCQGTPHYDTKELVKFEKTEGFALMTPARFRCPHPDGGVPGLPIAWACDQMGLIVSWPIMFAGYGQFVVTAEVIRSRPKRLYQRAYDITSTRQDGQNIFEPLWEALFTAPLKETSCINQ